MTAACNLGVMSDSLYVLEVDITVFPGP